MEILIDNSSMQPIYEQIAEQIKRKIIREEFLEQDALPSVRTFAKELKISALTVKKAYDYLEKQGFIVTVHGKGSFVASVSSKQVFEEKRREVKEEMARTVRKARSTGLNSNEIRNIYEEILSEQEGKR